MNMDVPRKKPLVADLNGTLIQTDLLIESAIILLKRNILFIFIYPIWLLKGKANLKHEIASRINLNAALLPYNEEFLDYLNTEHSNGREITLATASDKKLAEAVSTHLNIFKNVVANNANVNLSGKNKREKLESLFGNNGFVYAGNGMVDLDVWAGADSAILVNPGRAVHNAIKCQNKAIMIFNSRAKNPLKNYIKAIRLHQWLKNILIFIPLLLAHKFDDIQLLQQAAIGFISFGLCASSVYLLNDLLDLYDDRQHPTKKNRPFASGSISIVHGILLIPVLLFASFILSLFLPRDFILVLIFYYALTVIYSVNFKKSAPIDVITLAVLYTIRIIAGSAAVSIMPSFWLLAFSMFLFLSLALVKRITELLGMEHQEQTNILGRGYNTTDIDILSQFGSSSAYISVLILALYINSSDVQALYTKPQLIWMLCPIVLYLVTRLWLLTRRNLVDDDPVIFVIRDRQSQLLAMIAAVLLWLAI
jgi:4-hydroxybenzoate polyprenyltransferase